MPECPGHINFVVGHVNSWTRVPDLASAFFGPWNSLLLWASWSACSALKTKEILVTVNAHVIHKGISEGRHTSLIIFPTLCACVNPIAIDLIDVEYCDLSRNGGCLHTDYHNMSHHFHWKRTWGKWAKCSIFYNFKSRHSTQHRIEK